MDHTFVLYDRATQSVWYPGENDDLLAVGGVRRGSSLPFVEKPAPIRLGTWLVENPDSLVLLPTEDDADYWQRPWSGFRLSRKESFPVIERVFEDSPAELAGLRPGDRLQAVGGQPLEDRRSLYVAMAELSVGDSIEIEFSRDDEVQTLSLTMKRRP